MIREMLRSSYAALVTEQALVGASLLRFVVGLNILFIYLINYTQRQYLWGPEGIWPFQEFLEYLRTGRSFSLYQFSDSSLFFELVFHLGILATILFTIGYRTRLASIANWLFLWSLHERNPWILDGGDNIIRIALLFLLFANLGAYFSCDSARYWQRIKEHPDSLPRRFSAILHNFAVLAVITQVCIMYFITGLHKAMGEMWQEGVAAYYVLRVQDYYWPGVSDLIIQNYWLTVFITYMTVVFELAFPFLLFNTITRRLALLSGLAFHSGIAIFMALPVFQLFVISLYAVFISDREYRALAEWFQQWKITMAQRFHRFVERIRGYSTILRIQRVLVLYDGHCQLCTRSVETLKRLDLFSLIEFASFRNPDVVSLHNLDAQRLERRMHTKTLRTNDIQEGIDAVIQIAIRLIPLWPMVPVLVVARWLGLGQRIYDFIARYRMILLSPTTCVNGQCLGPADAARKGSLPETTTRNS